MHRINRSFVISIALLLAHQIAGIDAAGADEKRVEHNFTAASALGPKVPAVPAAALRIAKGKLAVRIGSRDYELETLTVTPPGDGPFPLAVVSHGTPTRGGKSALKKFRIRTMLAVAEDFARRGYKSVIFARRGYASSSGSFKESYGRCGDANKRNYIRIARNGAEDFAAVIEALAGQPDIDGSSVIAAGHSGGGFVVSALAAKATPGLIGVVNFAGGRGGQKDGGNCSKHGYVNAFGAFGDGAKVPALWLYSSTDRMFWPELVDSALEAYASNGAPVRLGRLGALWFTGNGHALHQLGGREAWSPKISAFLDDIGAPNWDTAPDDITVARLPPPSGVSNKGRRNWFRYLGYSGHKAFARGDGTNFGWAAIRNSVEEAKRDAIKYCEKRGSNCKVVSVDGARAP